MGGLEGGQRGLTGAPTIKFGVAANESPAASDITPPAGDPAPDTPQARPAWPPDIFNSRLRASLQLLTVFQLLTTGVPGSTLTPS